VQCYRWSPEIPSFGHAQAAGGIKAGRMKKSWGCATLVYITWNKIFMSRNNIVDNVLIIMIITAAVVSRNRAVSPGARGITILKVKPFDCR
jgi:hypothetical protein